MELYTVRKIKRSHLVCTNKSKVELNKKNNTPLSKFSRKKHTLIAKGRGICLHLFLVNVQVLNHQAITVYVTLYSCFNLRRNNLKNHRSWWWDVIRVVRSECFCFATVCVFVRVKCMCGGEYGMNFFG